VGVVPTPTRGALAQGARWRMLTSSRLPCFLSLAQEGCLKRLASLSKPFKYVGEFTPLPVNQAIHSFDFQHTFISHFTFQ